ncbi:MAG: hypothetical protein AAF845_16975 [Bacteroidota bacterium]
MRALPLLLAVVLAACSSGPSGPVTESGALEVGDLTLQSGEYSDVYSVSAGEGQWISVTLEADGFDPYLIIRTPSGQQSDIDDSEEGNTTSTSTVLRASEAGSYDVIVTSFQSGETGSYSVTYEVSDTQPGATPAADDTEETSEEETTT